jgi:oligoribonuclease NrnB/cAMP/cGMP phosphodiesterase (DHH superfamily)
MNQRNNLNELIVLTHNDLDALGCALNVEYKFPSIKKKYFYTNYANIKEIVQEIKEYCKDYENIHILIADVSFSDSKDSLIELNTIGKCTLIDHHLYPDNFWDEFKNMKVLHDKSKSGAKLCNEYFGNTGKNKNLDELTYLIDVYDLWQTENKNFDDSQDLNEYFWLKVQYNNLDSLIDEIYQRNFELPEDYSDKINEIKLKYNSEIADFERRNLIHRFDNITVAFVQNWFNQILISEMKKGQDVVIGITPSGIVRIRIKESSAYTPEQKNSLRLELTGTESIGHMNAFTYKINNVSMQKLMDEVKKIINTLKDFK